ncbi:MAG: hypothetical protein JWN30_698, partial [Bacilli bacterium]|nr:hypothetical protein [Bacilli bacterium]
AKVYPVPAAIDRQVAELRRSSWGIGIDQLSAEQQQYLADWNQ